LFVKSQRAMGICKSQVAVQSGPNTADQSGAKVLLIEREGAVGGGAKEAGFCERYLVDVCRLVWVFVRFAHNVGLRLDVCRFVLDFGTSSRGLCAQCGPWNQLAFWLGEPRRTGK